MFGSRVGFWRWSDRMALFPVGPNPRWRPSVGSRSVLNIFWMAISLKRFIRSNSYLVLGQKYRRKCERSNYIGHNLKRFLFNICTLLTEMKIEQTEVNTTYCPASIVQSFSPVVSCSNQSNRNEGRKKLYWRILSAQNHQKLRRSHRVENACVWPKTDEYVWA